MVAVLYRYFKILWLSKSPQHEAGRISETVSMAFTQGILRAESTEMRPQVYRQIY